jgi:hypothetical protein
MPEYDIPNLDAMDIEDVKAFRRACASDLDGKSKELFPDQPAGCFEATYNLEGYASLKINAINARHEGRMDDALDYEHSADIIYTRLPVWARW